MLNLVVFLHTLLLNIVFDGEYWYQYDAWNRLVQVNKAWRDDQSPYDVIVGGLVKHHAYDGFGRLVRTQSPVPLAVSLRTERFHYDGVRRIQEVVTDPVMSPGGAILSGDPELEQLALATVEPGTDEQATPLAFEQGQVELLSGGGGPGGGGGGGGGIKPPRIDREYVWGPGDNGLDELLVQYDRYGDEWWAIMDAGGDLVALCDLFGEGQYGDVARVVAQWTYDAYGAVLTAEHLDGYTLDAAPHLGHKGLFLDRLDASATSPRLVPFAHALYHVRNRVYSPQHGRWNQADPNQTALNLLEASVHHGRGVVAIVMAFDVEGLYGDGGNLYEYLGSNPWMRFDPMGLSWDPFDMVDDFYAEHMGSAAALLSQLGQSAKAVAVVAATIATYLPFPAASLAGEVALYALGETDASEFAVAAAIGLVPGGKLGSFIGKLGGSAWNTAKQYASRAGGFLARGAEGLAQRAKQFVRKGCGCFEAGTPVWTARGIMPIDQVIEGDLVFARNTETGEIALREVIGTSVRHGAPIVVVTITTWDGRSTDYRTTEEHPFWVESRGWVRTDRLEAGDAVLLLDGSTGVVSSIAFTNARATVYNFEVEGLHTYLVGTDGVLVHNAIPCFKPFTRKNLRDNLSLYRYSGHLLARAMRHITSFHTNGGTCFQVGS
ncbi:MAG: hypothetical protein KJZ54_10830 [Phycisphaerales bacterium]|nr:hypothetical protein [Phycisphaerales bacterium]